MKPKYHHLILCSVFLYSFCFSIDFYQGGFQGNVFLQSPDARGTALGGSLSALTDNHFSQLFNPALLARKPAKWHAALAYSVMSLDRSIQSVTVGRKVPPGAGVALSFVSIKVDGVIGRSYFGNMTEEFNWVEHRGILSFGLSPAKIFSIGVNLNLYLHDSIDEVSSNGMGIDGGLFISMNEFFNGSFTVRNVLAKSNWKIDMSDGTTRDYSESFPLIFSMAAHYKPVINLNSYFQADYFYQDELGYVGTDIRSGIEYFTGKVTIRAGIWNTQPALGFGLPLNKFYSKLDYAVLPGTEGEGMSYIFTWVFDK